MAQKTSKWSWPKILTAEVIREGVGSLLWSNWLFWGLPVLTVYMGYIEELPWVYILLAFLFAFAMTALGLNQLRTWQVNRTPENKVQISIPHVGLVLDHTTTPKKVMVITLGINAVNSAQFPMEISIDKLDAQISNKVPTKEFSSRCIGLPIGQTATFTSHKIDLSGETLEGALLQGKLQGEISYGKSGNLKYSANKEWFLALRFDKNGMFEGMEASHINMEI